MATAEDYAAWIVKNADKKGTSEFNIVAQAYGLAKQQKAAPAPAPVPTGPTEDAGFFGTIGETLSTGIGAAPQAAAFGAQPTEEHRKALIAATAPKYKHTEISDIHDLSSAWEAAKEGLGGVAGYVAPALGVGAISGPLAVGTVPATFATQHMVGNLAAQARAQQEAIDRGETPSETSLGKAALVSGLETGLDVIGTGVLSKLVPKPLAKTFESLPFTKKLVADGTEAKQATEALIDSYQKGTLTYKNGIAKGIGKGLAFAVPQMTVSALAERWQAGESVDPSDPVVKGIITDSLLNATAMGVVLGGAHGALHTRSDRSQAAYELGKRANDAQAAEDKIVADKAAADLAAAKPKRGKKAAATAAVTPPEGTLAGAFATAERVEPADPKVGASGEITGDEAGFVKATEEPKAPTEAAASTEAATPPAPVNEETAVAPPVTKKRRAPKAAAAPVEAAAAPEVPATREGAISETTTVEHARTAEESGATEPPNGIGRGPDRTGVILPVSPDIPEERAAGSAEPAGVDSTERNVVPTDAGKGTQPAPLAEKPKKAKEAKPREDIKPTVVPDNNSDISADHGESIDAWEAKNRPLRLLIDKGRDDRLISRDLADALHDELDRPDADRAYVAKTLKTVAQAGVEAKKTQRPGARAATPDEILAAIEEKLGNKRAADANQEAVDAFIAKRKAEIEAARTARKNKRGAAEEEQPLRTEYNPVTEQMAVDSTPAVGTEDILARLKDAKDKGELHPAAVDLATWFLSKNPNLSKLLSLSVVPAEEGYAGRYSPLDRLVTVMTGDSPPEAAVHEVLHSAERMMPGDMQGEIRAAWGRSVNDGLKSADSPAVKRFYELIRDGFTENDPSKWEDANALLDHKDLQADFARHRANLNPSEFWADNGARILAGRYRNSATVLGRMRTWLSEFGERLKNAFGLTSDHAVIRALNHLATSKGNYVSRLNISRQEGLESQPQRTPKAGIHTVVLPAAKPETHEQVVNNGEIHLTQIAPKSQILSWAKASLSGTLHNIYEKAVEAWQNDLRPLKRLEDSLAVVNRLVTSGAKALNIYSTIIRARDMAGHLDNMHLLPMRKEMTKLIDTYAKNAKLTGKRALATLNAYALALHEPERRWEFYRQWVPLSLTKNLKITHNGTTEVMSAADIRKRINDRMREKSTTPAEAKALGAQLDALVRDPKNLDKDGYSPRRKKTEEIPTDINHPMYNVIQGLGSDVIAKSKAAFDADPHKADAQKALDLMDAFHKKTIEFDRASNYWSAHTDKWASFYNFQHYVPLKAYHLADASHEFTAKRGISGEVVEAANSMEGGEHITENVILQSMADAHRAASRAGRRDVTQVLKNLIKETAAGRQGIQGKKSATIKADDRKDMTSFEMAKYQGPNKFLHHLPSGDIEVYEIKDPKILEAVRRPFQEMNPFNKGLTKITSWMGQMHTRYNPSFGPMNYLNDSLSNANNIAAKYGLKTGGNYLTEVTARTLSGDLFKAARISRILSSGDAAKLEGMKNDPVVRDIVRYMELGGTAVYRQVFGVTAHMTDIEKTIGRGKVVQNFDQIKHYFDAYNDMFDLTSRVAAFKTLRDSFMAEGMDKVSAETKAATEAKDLTNFRNVGKYGQAAGGIFMFFRPSASSAVAAIDALRPAWQSVEWRLSQLPKNVLADPAAKAAAIKNHMELQANARRLAISLVGAGAAIYTMSTLASGNDQQGRNAVAMDDKARWTRYIRLPVLGKDNMDKNEFLQIPWGFGLGSLGAIGAQLSALAHGHITTAAAVDNIIHAASGSFLPIQPSQINITQGTGSAFSFLLDSIMPSPIRPILEYAMNQDSMGNEIFNSTQGKYSNVFTGGQNIPQGYKDTAIMLAKITGYKLAVSPNTLYFFATNYADAIGRVSNFGYDIKLVANGEKSFDMKKDIPISDSFVGKASNVDAREFQSVQHQIKQKEQLLNSLKLDPESYIKYMTEHPAEQFLVSRFNTLSNGELKRIQTDKKAIQYNQQMTPKQKEDQLKLYQYYEDALKRNLIDSFRSLGIEP
jgi:hypothetical protein